MSSKTLVVIRRAGQTFSANVYAGRVKLAHLSGSWDFVRNVTRAIAAEPADLRNYTQTRLFIRATAARLGAVRQTEDRIAHRLLAEQQPFRAHVSGIRPQ